ncbi:MAG: extracellular solute-binding protein [Dehalococcoidia bacterium]|nr:extracellular solute-binding protein [Dehalococcoidia bacterium]MDZ4247287.1 extracellular solute-binding protein [Dehalococcoidia bacterium]
MTIYLIFALIISFGVLPGCAQKATPVPARTQAPAPTVIQAPAPAVTQAPAITKAAPAVPEWQQKWDKTVAEAKKEGKLNIYGGVNPETSRALSEAFARKYDIQLDFLLGRGSEVVVKYKQEMTAGINIPGAFNMSPSFAPQGLFAPIEPYLFLPEVTDSKVWIDGKVPYLDKEKTMIMLNRGYTSYTTVNTDMVKEGQIKSVRDLLKPEWKGKITLYDPGTASAAAAWATFVLTRAMNWEEGTDFLRALAATEPVMTRDVRQHIESVAKGKYAIALGAQQAATTDFIKTGAPVGIIRWQEGGMINTASGNLEVPAKPANPNAATVFINWMLTKEAQEIFVKSYGNPSWRADVSTEGIDPSRIPLPGEKLTMADSDFYVEQAKAMKLAKEIFGPLMK